MVLPRWWDRTFWRGRAGAPALLGGLALVLVVVSMVALAAVGEKVISPTVLLGMALQWSPIHPARTWSDVDLDIVTMIRLPRIVTAIMVGGALGITGAAYQALFRNPLADPGIVGTSAGASVGAIVAFLLPVQGLWFGFSLVPLAAFAGALGATLLVYALARVGGRLPSTTLLLAGFAVSAMLSAVSALVETLGDQLRQMFTWLLGSLDYNTGEQLLVAAPLLAVGMGGLLALGGDLNVLALGDEQAHYLGLSVPQRRLLVLALGALLTSVAVALGGMITLVGLLVPHIARLLFGANHRLLLPASLLVGALFLVVVDAVAHSVLGGGQILPVGLVTALVGGPWFIALLRRKKGEYAF
jgi:iron complex transport system permease protein